VSQEKKFEQDPSFVALSPALLNQLFTIATRIPSVSMPCPVCRYPSRRLGRKKSLRRPNDRANHRVLLETRIYSELLTVDLAFSHCL
jgi:hypothetical protein